MNVTGPVGSTVGDEIVAVKVTDCPCVDGFGDEVSIALLVVCRTTWFSTVDVLPKLAVSPTYTAVSGKVSALRFDLLRVAKPLLSSVADPIEKLPHVNFTFPVGVTEPKEVTVAVQLTFCPYAEGLRLELSEVDVGLGLLLSRTSTALDCALATTKSGSPSLRRSAIASDIALIPPEPKVIADRKVPVLPPRSTPTELSLTFATTTSDLAADLRTRSDEELKFHLQHGRFPTDEELLFLKQPVEPSEM